jgi:hypothetical protein
MYGYWAEGDIGRAAARTDDPDRAWPAMRAYSRRHPGWQVLDACQWLGGTVQGYPDGKSVKCSVQVGGEHGKQAQWLETNVIVFSSGGDLRVHWSENVPPTKLSYSQPDGTPGDRTIDDFFRSWADRDYAHAAGLTDDPAAADGALRAARDDFSRLTDVTADGDDENAEFLGASDISYRLQVVRAGNDTSAEHDSGAIVLSDGRIRWDTSLLDVTPNH